MSYGEMAFMTSQLKYYPCPERSQEKYKGLEYKYLHIRSYMFERIERKNFRLAARRGFLRCTKKTLHFHHLFLHSVHSVAFNTIGADGFEGILGATHILAVSGQGQNLRRGD